MPDMGTPLARHNWFHLTAMARQRVPPLVTHALKLLHWEPHQWVGRAGHRHTPAPPPSLDNTPLPISYNHYRSRQPSVCFVGAEEAQPAGIASTREQPSGQTHLLCPSGGSRRAHSVVSNMHECSPPQFAFWDRGGSACCSCPGPWSQYWGLGTIGSG